MAPLCLGPSCGSPLNRGDGPPRCYWCRWYCLRPDSDCCLNSRFWQTMDHLSGRIAMAITATRSSTELCQGRLLSILFAAMMPESACRQRTFRWRQKDRQAAKRISTHRKTGTAIIASIAPSSPPSHHPPAANASSIAALFASSCWILRGSFLMFLPFRAIAMHTHPLNNRDPLRFSPCPQDAGPIAAC